MPYHQRQYSLYNPSIVRIMMGNVNLSVTYLELLDESCVELQHIHRDSYEVYYCLDGEQHMVIDGTSLTLTSGNFVIIRPGVPHGTIYEPHLKKRYCPFIFTIPTISASRSKGTNSPKLDFPFSLLSYFESHAAFHSPDQYQAQEILHQLDAEFSASFPARESMVAALYQQYLIAILRHLAPANYRESDQSSTSTNLTIAITKYLHANYPKNITIQDVANEFFISPRHINRVFEDFFGQSFKRTLNIYRLNYAKNYLLDTDYSVEKIASLVGFSSAKTLYQLFKDVEGISITEFRARNSDIFS